MRRLNEIVESVFLRRTHAGHYTTFVGRRSSRLRKPYHKRQEVACTCHRQDSFIGIIRLSSMYLFQVLVGRVLNESLA